MVNFNRDPGDETNWDEKLPRIERLLSLNIMTKEEALKKLGFENADELRKARELEDEPTS